MDLTTSGAIRLFRAFGIDVYLHWTWFLVAWLQISWRGEVYQAPALKAAEYVTLFAIVLLHEFGHALACRSVGGRADRIVLWPLGGIAYVAPPPRPGAYLWSIAAGPLVNLVLTPVLTGVWLYGHSAGWQESSPDAYTFLKTLAELNLLLLIFNLLPIYPLDGGQILNALLWYAVGPWQSLLVVSLIGVGAGAVAFVIAFAFALNVGPSGLLLVLVAAFIIYRSVVGFQYARTTLFLLGLPRHADRACPHCGVGAPKGPFWVCHDCQTRFDLFDARGQCPACGAWYLHPACPHCGTKNHIDRWLPQAPPDAGPAEPAPRDSIPPA
jgi:Zn-dependent protease